MGDKISQNIILWYFIALFFISFFLLGLLLWPFISIVILAAVVTGVFKPVYKFFCKKISAPVASLLTCLLIFIVLFVPMVFFVSMLSKEAYDLYVMGKSAAISDQIKILLDSSNILERINLFLSSFNINFTGEQLNKTISELGKIVGLFLYEQASAIASNILKLLVDFFLMLLVIYFFLVDGNKLIAFIINLSPLPKEQDEKLIQKFKDMSGAILMGNGFCGLIQGVLGGTVFAVFGLKSSFLWGAIMTLLAFLPIIGIGAVFIPTAVFFFLKGKVAVGVFFIVFYIILSSSIEYLVKPILVGNRVRMHTLVVFFSIIGGLKLFGILGIIYGPLVATAFLTLTDIYHNSYKNMVGHLES